MNEMSDEDVIEADFNNFIIENNFKYDRSIHVTDTRYAMGLVYTFPEWCLKKSSVMDHEMY